MGGGSRRLRRGNTESRQWPRDSAAVESPGCNALLMRRHGELTVVLCDEDDAEDDDKGAPPPPARDLLVQETLGQNSTEEKAQGGHRHNVAEVCPGERGAV